LDLAIAQYEVWSQRNAQRIAESKRKNDITFWLIFGLSPNLGLSKTLSERLIQKVKCIVSEVKRDTVQKSPFFIPTVTGCEYFREVFFTMEPDG